MSQPYDLDVASTLRELAAGLVRATRHPAVSRTAASTLSRLDHEGPQRVTVLAERESITQPAMTGLVQRLEASALVTRTDDPDDGRATLITLTERGRDALAAGRARQDAVIAARVAHLSREDRAALVAALPALHALSEIHDRPSS